MDSAATSHYRIKPWITEFLNHRGLTAPDGRPLFGYKTTTQEYESLVTRLTNAGSLQRSTAEFDQAWFLFAAEWWKRHYPGGAWAWSPVFAPLNMEPPQHADIQSMVSRARRLWGLTGDLLGGKKYIGQVAINGGLPLRLLETDQGTISRILRSTLKHAIAEDLDRARIYAEIEAQSGTLPRSFRQASIYDLLTGIVETTQSLRSIHALAGETDPVAKLNRLKPDWVSKFPLECDNTSAELLLNGLVAEAATSSRETHRHPFQIARRLRFSSDGHASMEIGFEMPSQTKLKAVESALQLEPYSLPAVFQLIVRIEDADFLVGEAHLRQGDEVRLRPRYCEFPQDVSTKHAYLVASRYGADIAAANIPGGDALSTDEPWIFEDSLPTAELIKAGSARLKADSVLALLPESSVIDRDGLESLGDLNAASSRMRLFRLTSGTTRVQVDSQRYCIECTSSHAQECGSYWVGKMLRYESNPSTIYVDTPTLFVGNEDDSFMPVSKQEIYQIATGLPKRSLVAPQLAYGPCTLSWEKAQVTQSKTRLVLLPKDADIRFEKGKTPFEGIVRLKNWPCSSIRVLEPEVVADIDHSQSDWLLRVRTESPVVQSFTLRLLWPSGAQQLKLPFPGTGAFVVDRDQRPVASGSRISVRDIGNYKVRIMPGLRTQPCKIMLSLAGGRSDARDIRHEITYRGTIEIRLVELEEIIQRLISSSSELDALVTLEVIHGIDSHCKLAIGRYSHQIKYAGGSGLITVGSNDHDLGPSGVEDVGLLALPIQHPEQDPRELRQHLSETVFTGSWFLDFENEGDCTWMVYPDSRNRIDCRAVALPGPVPRNAPVGYPCALRDAMGEQDRDVRSLRIGEALASIAECPEDPGWELIGSLLQRLGHLPLSSLDIWLALSAQPSCMVMALLHIEEFAEDYASRIPSELPFEWLLTSPQNWIAAYSALKRHYETLNDNRGLRLLQADIDSKQAQMLLFQPGLRFILQLAKYFVFKIPDKDVQLFVAAREIIVNRWLDWQLKGDSSELQQFLRRTPADPADWPRSLRQVTDGFLESSWGAVVIDRFSLDQSDHRRSIISLPFLVATDVVEGRAERWRSDPRTLFALRQYRDFDSLWFDSAYVAALGMAYSRHLPI